MDPCATETRVVLPQRICFAASTCISQAVAHVSNKKYVLAIPFLEILDALPVAASDLRADLCAKLIEPLLYQCTNPRVSALTDAIYKKWGVLWETADA